MIPAFKTRSFPQKQINRRQAIKRGLQWTGISMALPNSAWAAFDQQGRNEQSIPFEDMPKARPNRLDWEMLNEYMTPQDQVFNVQHYGMPEFDTTQFKLSIDGLVNKPMSLSMDDIRAMPRKEQPMTLECSGNGAGKGFMDAIYNSRWTGTPLASLLAKCEVDPKAVEVVFYGKDTKEEVLRPDTNRELKIKVPFGRSMTLENAMNMPLLLAYERNGNSIEHRNGAPLRLIVPGWYGVANVKWLTRIELRDRRYMGRYMARDYVTVRGQRQADELTYVETSVTKMNLKSIIARVTRKPTRDGTIPLRAYGAAWGDGTEIVRTEVQLNHGPWQRANWDTSIPKHKYCWRFFWIDLGNVKAGEHTLVSRAVDVNGRIQPAAEDDEISLKKTYWEAYQQWPRKIILEA
ncbi:molybdopterin-dependent oxidoreductase [bacterium]|nr:molybdopterin-dependent oxidoreductase [bacterium]MDG1893173.1 molybdopterin-dependent oxidoreductase [Verrucomicrobiota bacterium]